MGVYRIKLAGRTKPVLLRAKSKTEAIERVVDEVKSLTGDEVEALLESGERVWKVGEPFPADETRIALHNLREEVRDWVDAVGDDRPSLTVAVELADAALAD